MQVLSADVVRINSFGAARGIKHLMLELLQLDCSRLSLSLAVLEQLQTLCVSVLKRPERQTAGALELTELQALRSVRLVELLPESIELGDSCELHVVTHNDCLKIEHPVWDTVFATPALGDAALQRL